MSFFGGSLNGGGGMVSVKYPTITGFTIANRNYSSDASFVLTQPNSNSAGTFSYRTNDPTIVTASGNKLYVVGAGTAIVTAYQNPYSPDFLAGSIDTSFIIIPIPPTQSNFTITSKSFSTNGSFQLTNPTSNSAGSFTFSSGNTSIATIIGNRVIYQNAGTVTITASQAANGGYTSKDISANLVINTVKPTLSGFSISAQNFLLNMVVNLTAPTSNSAGTITYTSGNTTVATVSGNTLIIKKAGTTVITASQASYLGYTAADISTNFVVNTSTPTITNFSIAPQTFVTSGTVTLVDPSSNSTGGVFSYTSGNTSIATISSKTLTMIGAGTVNIRATQSASGDYATSFVDLSLVISKGTPTYGAFTNQNYTASTSSFTISAPVSSTSSGAYTYSSSNPTIASISGTTVSILSAGEVTITANQAATTNFLANSVSKTLTITAIPPTIGNITTNSTDYIANKTNTIVLPTTNSSGQFTFSSSNTNVATFTNRNVMQYIGPGTTTITATQSASGKYTSGSVTAALTVYTNPSITNYTITDASYSIGGTKLIVDPSSNSSGAFTYTSNNTAVATVSSKTITFVSAGVASITASQAANGIYRAGTTTTTFNIDRATPSFSSIYISDVSFVSDLSFAITNPTSNSTGAFTFTSGNTSVATITKGNVVIINDIGSSVITGVQAETSNYLASNSVTTTLRVNKATPTITFPISDVSLIYNGTFQLANPKSISAGNFTFTSGNTSVATVTSNGLITMIKSGSTPITVTQAETDKYLQGTKTTTLNVNKIYSVIDFSMSPVTFVDSSAVNIRNPNSTSNGNYLYSSGDNNIASITGNTAIMKSAGNVVITATQLASGDFILTSKSTTFRINKTYPTITYNIPDVSFISNGTIQIPSGKIPLPTSNSNGEFVYDSDNEAVAVVTNTGLITMKSVGSFNMLVYQRADGSYLDKQISAPMTFVPGPSSLDPFSLPSATFVYNTTINLPGDVTSPLSDGAITFTSGNTSIATISGNTLTMKRAGNVSITATQAANANYASASYTTTLTIYGGSPTLSYSIPSQTYVPNGTYTLPNPTSNSSGSFTFSSSDTTIASISGNTLTKQKAGTIVITAAQSASGDYNSASISASFTINKTTPTLSNFSISDASFVNNGTFSLSAPTTNSNGAFSYTSGNTSIATVTAGGLVTMKSSGNVVITANLAEGDNYNTGSITATLRITPGAPVYTSSSLSTTYVKNGTYAIPALPSSSSGNVTYTSGNVSKATISGNTVTMLKAGSLQINAAQTASGDYVAGNTVLYLTINKGTPTLSNFAAITTPYAANGTYTLSAPTSNSTGAFSYTSADTTIASVLNNVVTKQSSGTTTITATQNSDNDYNGSSISTNLTISPGAPTLSNFSIPTLIFSNNGTSTITDPVSNSTGSFTYSSSNPSIAAVAGNVVTMKSAGNVTITAYQNSAGNYDTGSISATLTIKPAATILSDPTISAFSVAAQDFSANATFTLTPPTSNSSGAFSYASSNTSIASIAGTTVTVKAIGTVNIRATQLAFDTYRTGFIDASFTVNRISPTITFNDSIKPYVSGPFMFDLSTNSPGLISYSSSDLSICTISNTSSVSYITNGNFEEGISSYSNGITFLSPGENSKIPNYTKTIPGWSHPNFLVGIIKGSGANGYGINPQSGSACFYIQNYVVHTTTKSNVYQTLSNIIPNTSYTLSFYANSRNGSAGAPLLVQIDNTQLMNSGVSSNTWTLYTYTFTSSSTTPILKFTNNGGTNGDLTIFIDNVTIQPTNTSYPIYPTLLSSGSCTITATQDASGNFAAKTVSATFTFNTSSARLLNRFSDFNQIGGNDISLNGNVLCSALDQSNNCVYYGGSFNKLLYYSNAITIYNTAYDSITFSDASNNCKTNGNILCSTFDTKNQILYVGGTFTKVFDSSNGSISANNIAKWNCASQSWSVMGDFSYNGVDGTVYTLALDGQNNIHVGGRFSTGYMSKNPSYWSILRAGSFTSANTNTGANYFTWNNAQNIWTAYTIGNTGTSVNALAYDALSNNMYIGASQKFNVFSTDYNYIAKLSLNNGTWSSVGANGVNGAVNALLLDNSQNLYVGGAFTAFYNISSVATSSMGIARFSTSSTYWYTLNGAGLGSTSYRVFALANDLQNNVYVGGYLPTIYQNTALITCNNIVKWNVSAGVWNTLGSSANNGVNGNVLALSLDISNNKLYTGGSFTAVYDNTLQTKPYSYGAKWDITTSSWKNILDKTYITFSNSINNFTYESYSKKLYIHGTFASFSQSINNVFRYDLSSASVFSLGVDVSNGTSGNVNALALDVSNNLYVGGSFANVYDSSSNVQNVNNVAIWNIGSKYWTSFGSGTAPTDVVNSILYDNTNDLLYAAGSLTSINGVSVNNIAKLTNSTNTWSPLGSTSFNGTDGSVNVIMLDNNKDLYVGGTFSSVFNSSSTPTAVNKIAKYTVSSNQWSAMGSGVSNGNVKALSYDTSNSFVYAGGDFSNATDISGVKPCLNIAYWNVNTSRWNNLGNTLSTTNGTNNTVNAVFCDSSNQLVYVAGAFTRVKSLNNDIFANRIAIWNNTINNWNRIGDASYNGFDGTVNSMTFHAAKNTILFGGEFITANDASYSNNPASKIAFACYNTNPYVLPLTMGSLTIPSTKYNNLYNGDLRFRYTFDTTSMVSNTFRNEVTGIYDLSASTDATLDPITVSLVTGAYANSQAFRLYRNQHLTTNIGPISMRNGITISSWVKIMHADNFFDILDSNFQNVYTINYTYSAWRLTSYGDVSSPYTAFNDSNYHYVTVTNICYPIPESKIYIDGNLIYSVNTYNTAGTSGGDYSTKMFADKYYYLSMPYPAGADMYVDDLRIYQSVLPYTQIRQLYNNSELTIPNGGSLSVPLPVSPSLGKVTYSSSDSSIVSISNNTLTVNNPGTVTITATQAPSGIYAGGSTTTSYTIGGGPVPTIGFFTSVSKTFGNAPFTLTAPSSNSSGAFSYTSSNISVATVTGNTVTIVGAGTSYITANQAATATYSNGSVSMTLTVAALTPTITGFSIPAKTFGDSDFTLTDPTSNSSAAFTYTSANTSIATVTGNVVHIVNNGTVAITASQQPTSSYLSGSLTANLVIAKMIPTITGFSIPSKAYGSPAFTLNPPSTNATGAFSYTSSNTSVATINGSSVTITGAGTSTITATQASDSNYQSGSITATLTVTTIAPTIGNWTITPVSPILTILLSNILPSSNSSGSFSVTSSDPTVAAVSGSSIITYKLGTTILTATQSAAGNYNSSTITATLSVISAPPTFTAWAVPMTSYDVCMNYTLPYPTSNSQGTYTFTSSNSAVASINGRTISVVNYGTTVLTATQSASGDFLQGSTSVTFNISAATSTIVANKFAVFKAGTTFNGGIEGVVCMLLNESTNILYIGGDFTSITYLDNATNSNVTKNFNRIAGYNLTSQTYIQLGNNTYNGVGITYAGSTASINCMTFDLSNNLYVGGIFNTVYDTSNTSMRAYGVAKWSFTTNAWYYLGGNPALTGSTGPRMCNGVGYFSLPNTGAYRDDYNGTVNTLTYDYVNDYLYVGGLFYAVAGTFTNFQNLKVSGTGINGMSIPYRINDAGFVVLDYMSVEGIHQILYNPTANNWTIIGGICGYVSCSTFDNSMNLYIGGNISDFPTSGNTFNVNQMGYTLPVNSSGVLRFNKTTQRMENVCTISNQEVGFGGSSCLYYDKINLKLYIGGCNALTFRTTPPTPARFGRMVIWDEKTNDFTPVGNSNVNKYNWTGYNYNGVYNGIIKTFAMDTKNKVLYVGGAFPAVNDASCNHQLYTGGYIVNYIAGLDTVANHWYPIGTSVLNPNQTWTSNCGTNSTVSSLLYDSASTKLYVGGAFTSVKDGSYNTNVSKLAIASYNSSYNTTYTKPNPTTPLNIYNPTNYDTPYSVGFGTYIAIQSSSSIVPSAIQSTIAYRAVCISADNKRMVIQNRDKSILYTTMNSSTLTWNTYTTLTTSYSNIFDNCMVLTHDGNVGAFPTNNYCYIFKWNGSGYSTPIQTLDTNSRNYTAMAISPDGSMLVVASNSSPNSILYALWNGTNFGEFVTISNLSSGSVTKPSDPTYNMSISEDNKRIAFSAIGYVYWCDISGTTFSNPVRLAKTDFAAYSGVQLSKDKSVLFISDYGLSNAQSGWYAVWDATSNNYINPTAFANNSAVMPFTNELGAFCLSPDMKSFYYGTANNGYYSYSRFLYFVPVYIANLNYQQKGAVVYQAKPQLTTILNTNVYMNDLFNAYNTQNPWKYSSNSNSVVTCSGYYYDRNNWGALTNFCGGGTAKLTATWSNPNESWLQLFYEDGKAIANVVVKEIPFLRDFTFSTATISANGTASITPPNTNSSGALTYTSSNTSVATVNGSLLTILSAGTTILTAYQAASDIYIADNLSISINVASSGSDFIVSKVDNGLLCNYTAKYLKGTFATNATVGNFNGSSITYDGSLVMLTNAASGIFYTQNSNNKNPKFGNYSYSSWMSNYGSYALIKNYPAGLNNVSTPNGISISFWTAPQSFKPWEGWANPLCSVDNILSGYKTGSNGVIPYTLQITASSNYNGSNNITFWWTPSNGDGGNHNNNSTVVPFGWNTGRWFHIGYTMDNNGTENIYINGTLVKTTTVTNQQVVGFGAANTTNNFAGSTRPSFIYQNEVTLCGHGNSSYQFFGYTYLDNFSIYNKILSASYMSAIYNDGNGLSLV